MRIIRADLHIHSVLSPCGELEMSPANIIAHAQQKKLDMIAISDHNSTRQAAVIRELGKEKGIKVLYGAEVTTKEEVHVLCLLPDKASANEFQMFIDANLPNILNKEELFGYQVAVNRDETIIYNEKRLLLSALNQSIESIEKTVHRLGGLFIPAHVERMAYGLFPTLGIMPEGLKVDALEYSYNIKRENFCNKYPEYCNSTLITSSDAHRLRNIGRAVTLLKLKKPSFNELAKALKGIKGRKVEGVEYAG